LRSHPGTAFCAIPRRGRLLIDMRETSHSGSREFRLPDTEGAIVHTSFQKLPDSLEIPFARMEVSDWKSHSRSGYLSSRERTLKRDGKGARYIVAA
jgi:hypothetical protein